MSDSTKPQPATTPMSSRTHRLVPAARPLGVLIALIALISVGAQLIGPLVIPVGVAAITFLPMIWGLLTGILVSAQRVRPMPVYLQDAAGVIMSVAVLVLCARLAFTIGPNIPLVLDAGPALLLQEVGHLFGTILLALPLAVLLKMGPATIGATFSIDREGSFAMVSERYGPSSPQYRGVLSMYVFGTVFGALLVSLIASLASSLGIFDARALAMGAGVGSGSMMAAAAAAVGAQHPDLSDQVLALAATSNLITGFLGLYVGVWIALPLAEKFYRLLARDHGDLSDDEGTATTPEPTQTAVVAPPRVHVPLLTTMAVLIGIGFIVSSVAAGRISLSILVGYLVMAALVAVGIGVARVTRGKLPAIIVVVTVGALLSSPASPVDTWMIGQLESIDFLSVCTLLLSVAGLSLGKELPMLRKIGWKIIPVGVVSITASFLLSAVVAEFALGLWG